MSHSLLPEETLKWKVLERIQDSIKKKLLVLLQMEMVPLHKLNFTTKP